MRKYPRIIWLRRSSLYPVELEGIQDALDCHCCRTAAEWVTSERVENMRHRMRAENPTKEGKHASSFRGRQFTRDAGELETPSNKIFRSPLTILFEEVSGARALYALIATVLILCTLAEEVECAVDKQYDAERRNFYRESFSPLTEFLKIWLSLHLILYLIVYPCGKYLSHLIHPSLSALVSVFLIKFVLLFMVKNAADRAMKLSLVLSIAAGAETVRLIMKTISFLCECIHQETRDKASLVNFTYFLFAPTLIFKVSYRRNSGPINRMKAFVYLLEFALIAHVSGIFVKNYCYRACCIFLRMLEADRKIKLSSPVVIMGFFTGSLGSIIIFINIAFAYFQSFCNFTGEILRFKDRIFYGWWFCYLDSSATTMRQYNVVIHQWFVQYIYKNVAYHTNKSMAVFFIFVISGFYHDFIVFIAIGSWTPYFSFFMGCFVALAVIMDKNQSSLASGNPRLYLVVVLILTSVTYGCFLVILAIEHTTRLLCPREPNESWFFDTLRPRMLNCVPWYL